MESSKGCAMGLNRSSSDKKEECKMDAKCNGGCLGGSEVEVGYIFQSPMNANGMSSRKRRVKLQGEVPEVRCHVDHALVPRRLRSAMNKCISRQSASPPLSDSKRRQHHASNGTPNSARAERFKQNMIDEVTKEVTKEEKEVAEALTTMASLIMISKPVKKKENETMLEENPEINTHSSSPLEAPKVEGTKVLLPCNGGTATELSHRVEDSPETMKADPSKPEQPTAATVSQKFDAEVKGPSQPDSLRKLSSNIKPIDNVTDLSDPMNTSNPVGDPLQHFPGNGMLQPALLDALVVQKQELELWPPGHTSVERDLQTFKQTPGCVSHDMSQKVTDVKTALHNRGHEQLTMPTSSKTSTCTISVTVSGRSGSRNGFPTEKVSLTSADKKYYWNKCAAHVHISHLIQNYQKPEKKQPSISRNNPPKPKEGTSCSVPASGETSWSKNGAIPHLDSASLTERCMMEEARNRMIQDGRLRQAQQAAALSGAYAPQKQSSGNGMKSSVQLHGHCHLSQDVMASAFPRGSFSSQYQEQLAFGAAHQVQLQLPPYVASNQLYGPHMGQAAGDAATKQQQQLMWQAHLAHYRSPVGFPPRVQQNGRQCDSLSFPLVSPISADYNQYNLHQPINLPMPSSLLTSPSRSKQHHQRNGGGLNTQSSLQLQLISNAEGFR